MRYAGIIYDDTAAAPGLCLSFYTQGCPIHCKGCHNPETWNPDGGHEFTSQTIDNILEGLTKQGIQRSFAVLGGEPLSPGNLFLTAMVVQTVREKYSSIPIWIWTGYTMEELAGNASNPHLRAVLNKTNVLVTGPFIEEERDITLKWRGSANQKVYQFDPKKNLWYNIENEKEEFTINGRTN